MDYPWHHQRRFNAYANYFREKFGYRVQKLSIDAGFTCPNRDGTLGTQGCTFCSNPAFNPSYCMPEKTIAQQIEEGKGFHRWRYQGAAKYLAYFQAYSNTYASLDHLKKVYEEALAQPDVIGLVIGTRPDCVDDEKLQYIASLSKSFHIVVEYGVESCYDKTLERIHRGHDFRLAEKVIRQTADGGILTGAHFIFGLPGETMEEMLATAGIISNLPLHSVKFHQLQILKDTPMERDYFLHPDSYHFFKLEEYIDFMVDFLERLSPQIIVERFAGEVPPRFQAGPTFGNIRNDQILSLLEKRLEERQTFQGRLFMEHML